MGRSYRAAPARDAARRTGRRAGCGASAVQRGNPMPKAGDAVADAINEHRLIREMTPVQAAEAMGVKAQWQTDTMKARR